ncbi:chalcone--flavanone isomerase-like isoform X2 [Macadamia integrifolia]|uniref:chalcone--flavanone isomerase-like isoform X2 n=1 Tax=Macadamia integrifolia TaxID=60698 RepID=UPI001C527920|nr:chalcone--flavanone isomerase-like isoform X2 [Macadamia integrifolia]
MAPGAVMVPKLQVEEVTFPGSVKPPGSTNILFLGGAGVRGLEIQGQFIKFTTIGIYLGQEALPSLASKWKGKTIDELTSSLDFFSDIVSGEFEKFIKVTMLKPLTGQMYAEKVTENCVAYWKAVGIYSDAEAKAVEEFTDTFKDENFPPLTSILFTLSPHGSLTIAFSKAKDGAIPEVGSAVIENKQLAEAVLESIIGKHGVSPVAKQSLAERIHGLLLEFDAANVNVNANALNRDKVEVVKQENGDSVDKVEVVKQENGDSICKQ